MIGIFDSGLGGLSVLAAIARALPGADLTFLADTANMPYGPRSNAFIRGRVLAIGHHLADLGCGMIVVACNTATAAAVQALRAELPKLPVVGVEPGVKPAAKTSPRKHIAVLATESTSRSDRLARLIRTHCEGVQVDIAPCPNWATRVEALNFTEPAFVASVKDTVEPLLAAGADRLVLGCTHYGFLAPVLNPLVAGRAELVDVAEAVARQAVRRAGSAAQGRGRLVLEATARPEALPRALNGLGLGWLAERSHEPPRLVGV
ncbi:glutamate racemase [Azospira inquinata]|uniref:Glutamate racemase n=1 Tax=Azospira inquinata TaxID=2785627 RepID=A0A975XUC6_9RHOO|nr:glutamate racemase [Azospira inquinata]QWT46036.1 glutamate racemase [Azospira inquinata]QWT48634.1 glutamate racemase [Azospira inquinata]